MFCGNCGTQLPDGTLFCSNCGAKQEAGMQPAQLMQPVQQMQRVQAVPMTRPKKKSSPLKIIIPIVAVALVLCGVLAALLLLNGRSGKKGIPADMPLYAGEGYGFVNLSGGKLEEENVDSAFCSANNGTTMYLTYDDELYYVTKDMRKILVSRDVCDAQLSVSGEYAAYTVNENNDPAETTLYIYNVAKDNSVKIDRNVYAYNFALSPSGKTVAYLKNYESYTDNTLYVGGLNVDSKKIDRDGCYPIALTDNGKNVYYRNSENKLYYYNGKESIKIAADSGSTYWFNSSVTEMLFVKNGKTYYYTPKLEEAVKISGCNMLCVVSPQADDFYQTQCSGYGQVLPYDTLKGRVLYCYEGLYWFNSAGTETIKITSSTQYKLAEDEKSLIYLSSGRLYRIDKFDENMTETLLYDKEEVVAFIASANLKNIYLVTEEKELLYCKGPQKADKISNDFNKYDSRSSAAYCEAAGKIYYIEDNKLFCAGKNAKSRVTVREDVQAVGTFSNGIVYMIDDGDVYYTDGKNTVLLYEK